MKSVMSSTVVALLLFELLIAIATININFCNGSTYVGCIETEREALLRFKKDLKDPSNRLVSWIGDRDCCKWAGVVCNNFTGNVHRLQLGNPFTDYFTDSPTYYKTLSYITYEDYESSMLIGKINPSLLDLKHLVYLDLSGNNFSANHGIPSFLGSMINLRYLNLSFCQFSGGLIPPQLGNLSDLQYLDLHHDFEMGFELHAKNLNWLSGLSLLKYLDLSGVKFSNVSYYLLDINRLPHLVVLKLSSCEFPRFPLLPIANFTSLATLDLDLNFFNCPIPEVLKNLTSLRHLDLSYNDFNSSIPNWFYKSFSHLEYLSLRQNSLQGMILGNIGSLTSLRHLDLSDNDFNSSIPNWFYRSFSYLEYLSLRQNSLQGMIVGNIGNLTSLRHLDLSDNDFNSSIPNWFCRSFSHLEYLSLSGNRLRGMILGNIGNLTSLQNLDLSYNDEIEEKIPRSWKRLCNLKSISLSSVNLSQQISEILDIFSECISVGLESLDLSDSQLSGHFTNQLGKLKNVHTLDLSRNSISGPIPVSLEKLSFLKFHDFSCNKLNGTLSEIHFFNLSHLESFDISKNSLKLEVSHDWIPPFQLRFLGLRSCHLGPEFPPWLSSQKYLYYIDISNSRIDDRIPNRFWKSSFLSYLNFSHNQIHGIIPNLTISFDVFDLSWNNFSGPLPLISSNDILYLSNNFFSGPIFLFFCIDTNKPMNTEMLNLQNNLLSRELPDCWSKWKNLIFLNLGNNKFTGNLPLSMGTLSSLFSLHLQRNNLSGIIPMSFKNFTALRVLDLSENEFMGNIPAWIGESLLQLKILNLHSNNFDGLLPVELCHLDHLQILNLFDNNLFGIVPRCVNNFSAMVTIDDLKDTFHIPFGRVLEKALLVMKGQVHEYSTNLNLVRSIDLSVNNFSGEIPIELRNLGALQSLNLSQNSFTGTIPESIGAMKSLESIDFSANQLSGKIPPNFSNLTFLSYLNLSNNKLIGEIPLSTQLQGFAPSCFIGNKLCGPPLEQCPVKMQKNDNENGGDGDDNKHEVDWGIYVSMAIGFVMGFWIVLFPLFVSKRWRCTYYRFLSNLWEKFYVAIVRRCY